MIFNFAKEIQKIMNINKSIALIEKSIKDPTHSLPEDIFLLVSRITPLINVDLLIKNDNGETLLTWRGEGETTKPGWHVPGGIVRFKETIADRVHAVAKNELGTKVSFENNPLAINEIMLKQINRGHFISLLYSCQLLEEPDPNKKFKDGTPNLGEWSWHEQSPELLISTHSIYKKYF